MSAVSSIKRVPRQVVDSVTESGWSRGGSQVVEEPTETAGLGVGMTSSGSSVSVARFPKLDECAHFHYEHVELGRLEVALSEAGPGCATEQAPGSFAVRVTSGDACWTLQRSHDNLVMFDRQLHRCIFDRSYSQLPDLGANAEAGSDIQAAAPVMPATTASAAAAVTPSTQVLPDSLAVVDEYLRRFSSLSHDGLNCGPVLNWLQLDNRGRRILVPEADSCPINTPAVAAAYAVRPHRAQAPDEISFQVGDMISVIDMPPAGESSWWRGKRGFDVGFFPAECVALIGDKLPRHLTPASPLQHQQQQQQSQPQQQPQQQGLLLAGAAAGCSVASTSISNQTQQAQQPQLQQPVKPVLRKHGKLIAFFRSFILNRPSRRRLKQSGILRERVFGCDLGEHLLNTGREVPSVLSCCADFIERHGLVDGIYRLSGVTSNIQRLRHAFDEDRLPALHTDESILQDIHSVASLLKMYFRELPNPLCTYQLYSTFVTAVQSASDAERLARMREAVRKLPPPHYRTLEYLMRHLVRVASRGDETGMTPRNVAIVWAPNLLRCKELEVGGVAALQGVGVQAVVTEFLICYAELIFAVGPSTTPLAPTGQRPKSLAIASSSARLLTLEEARNRSLAPEPELIEVGPGAAGLPARYHTVIELPNGHQRKRTGSKRSPSLNWRALFGRASAPARQSTKLRLPVVMTTSAGATTSTGTSTSRAAMTGAAAAATTVKMRSLAVDSSHAVAVVTSTSVASSSSSSSGGSSSSTSTATNQVSADTVQPQQAGEPGLSNQRRLRPVKSADSLEGAATLGSEDALGPLHGSASAVVAAAAARACGHSRSVSHDSYFEQLTELASVSSAPSTTASALDLSEIQLSFKLEEREMRMLSGEESLEASPRRQRSKQERSVDPLVPGSGVDASPSNSVSPAVISSSSSSCSPSNHDTCGTDNNGGATSLLPIGGSKRKRSRLEERLQCEVELRFIDSQSPDQIMVSADVHEAESPSPLPTPGYLPLLSEASTPLTPIASPAAISPRISFKSFSMPLEVNEPMVSPTKEPSGDNATLLSCLMKAQKREDNTNSCLDLNSNADNFVVNQNNAMDATDDDFDTNALIDRQNLSFGALPATQIFDQEMTSCDQLFELNNEITKSSLGSDVPVHLTKLYQVEEHNEPVDKSNEINSESMDQNLDVERNDVLAHVNSPNSSIREQKFDHNSCTNYFTNTSDKILANFLKTSQSNNGDQQKADEWLIGVPTVRPQTLDQNQTGAKQLQRIENPSIANVEATQHCQSATNDFNIHSELSSASADPSSHPIKGCFNSSKGDSSSMLNSTTNEISNLKNQSKLINLRFNMTMVPSNCDSVANCLDSNFATTNLDYQKNESIEKIKYYQSDQSENQMSTWDSLILAENKFCKNDKHEINRSVNVDNQQSAERPQQQQQLQQENLVEVKTNDELRESQNVSVKPPDLMNNCGPISSNTTEASSNDKCHTNYNKTEPENLNTVQDISSHDDLEVVIPLESAAVEPQEMAHVPDVLCENNSSRSSRNFSCISNKNLEQHSILHKDTATVLQELALQRLSGGDRMDSMIPNKKKYDSEYLRDRRSFDSEIGREIVREHKMKQELERARGKFDESLKNNQNQNTQSAHLPPCLRARHARATRATLSRSLDEAKFNKMTSGTEVSGVVRLNQQSDDSCEVRRRQQQHSSTPDVGSKSSSNLSSAQSGTERSTQSLNKNLGLDLDDPRCRERIEKYKEERRTFLRDKYRSESFRATATSPAAVANDKANGKEDEEQALLIRLKQRASKPSPL